MKEAKREVSPQSNVLRDLGIGIVLLIISFFFLFTQTGKSIFVPFEDCKDCLQFYYYLISYTLTFVGFFLLLRGLGIIRHY